MRHRIIRSHRMPSIRPITTDVIRLCVGHTDVLRKNGRTDQDAVSGADYWGSSKSLLDEDEIPHGKGKFLELSRQWKALAVSAAVYAAKGAIQPSITARHMRCGLSSKFLTTFFVIQVCHVDCLPYFVVYFCIVSNNLTLML